MIGGLVSREFRFDSPGKRCVWLSLSANWEWTGCCCQSYSWSVQQRKWTFQSLFAPESLISRVRFGRPVPRQPAHLPHPQAESGAYLRDSTPPFRYTFHYNRHALSASPEFIRSRNYVTDGFRYRESAGTGPAVFKIAQQTEDPIQVTNPMNQLICPALSVPPF